MKNIILVQYHCSIFWSLSLPWVNIAHPGDSFPLFTSALKSPPAFPPNLVKINSITHTCTVKYIFFSSNICFDNLSICFLNLSGSKFVTKCYLWQPRSQFLTQCTVQAIEEWRSLSNFFQRNSYCLFLFDHHYHHYARQILMIIILRIFEGLFLDHFMTLHGFGSYTHFKRTYIWTGSKWISLKPSCWENRVFYSCVCVFYVLIFDFDKHHHTLLQTCKK